MTEKSGRMCRPDSASTETTRLTLPSETSLSMTTDSAFRAVGRATEFADYVTAKNREKDQESKFGKKKKEAVKEEETLEYKKQTSVPIAKRPSSKKEKDKGSTAADNTDSAVNPLDTSNPTSMLKKEEKIAPRQ